MKMSGGDFIERALFRIAGPVSGVDGHEGGNECNLPRKPERRPCSNIRPASSESPEEERLSNRLCREFAGYFREQETAVFRRKPPSSAECRLPPQDAAFLRGMPPSSTGFLFRRCVENVKGAHADRAKGTHSFANGLRLMAAAARVVTV